MNKIDIFKNLPINQQLIHFRNINPKHHVKLYLSLEPNNQYCILDKLRIAVLSLVNALNPLFGNLL